MKNNESKKEIHNNLEVDSEMDIRDIGPDLSSELKSPGQIQKSLNEITFRIYMVEKEISDLTNSMLEMKKSDKRREDMSSQIKKLQSTRYTYMEQRDQLNKELQLIDGQKLFDKKTCIENIRFLLSEKSVKLGDIERDAGVSAGYLSRLEKKNNTTDPSIEFLMVASKRFGVFLDTLVNTKLSRVTKSEEELIQFLIQLKKDTDDDRLAWVGDSVEKLHSNKYVDPEVCQPHPLYLYPCDSYGPTSYSYSSLFFEEKKIDPSGTGFHAKLQDSEDEVYLMKVREDREDTKGDEFLELYHVDGEGMVYPICNTLQVSQEISDAVEVLYESVAVASSHVRLTEKTKSLIGNYLKTKTDKA